MNYSKVVTSGNIIEIYQYEQHPPRFTDEQRQIALFRRKQTLLLRGTNIQTSTEQEYKKRQDNVRRASMAFRRLAQANLTRSTKPVFLTLTYAEDIKDPTRAYQDFNAFTKRLKKELGEDYCYIAVPEFQDKYKRGVIHFHALVWGITPDMVERERDTRRIAKIWGKGFIDLVQTDAHEKIASYMAKYMAKNFTDTRLFKHKAYLFSRNCYRPNVDKNAIALSYIYEYDLSTIDPLQDVEFQSQWMGKGRYRMFNLNSQK